MGSGQVEFEEALKLIYEMGDVLLVVEEVQFFSSTHSMPDILKYIILTGRHRKIAFFATTQRPGELHKTLLSQAAHIFAGPIHESNDIKYLKGFLGDKAEKLLDLEQDRFGCEFLYWQPSQASKIIKIKYPV
jgi:DNA helicase HerA-like ATPase